MALELREHLDRPRGKPSIIYLFGPFVVENFVSIVESLEKFTHYDYGSHMVTTDRHIEFPLGPKVSSIFGRVSSFEEHQMRLVGFFSGIFSYGICYFCFSFSHLIIFGPFDTNLIWFPDFSHLRPSKSNSFPIVFQIKKAMSGAGIVVSLSSRFLILSEFI